MPEQTLNRPHYRRTLAITALALAVLLILGIRFGSTRLDLALIAHGISGTLTPEEAPHWYAFHQMRLPRARHRPRRRQPRPLRRGDAGTLPQPAG